MKTRNRLAILFMVIGTFQIAGYTLNLPFLRGIGLASGIAPFTKVFCDADGYEAFAASFLIQGVREDGSTWSRPLDPEWYAQLQGPYNRRNVYGAALSFAPRLPWELRDVLIKKSLVPGSALRRELGVPEDLKELQVVIISRPGADAQSWTYHAPPPASRMTADTSTQASR